MLGGGPESLPGAAAGVVLTFEGTVPFAQDG